MNDEYLMSRITCNPAVLVGKPVIQNTRLSVEHILNLRAHGTSESEILAEYPGLTNDDILACYLYAGKSLEQTRVLPLSVGVG